jgi:hypothetical protein
MMNELLANLKKVKKNKQKWNETMQFFSKKKAGPHGSVGQAWIIDQMMSARCIPLVILPPTHITLR